MKAKEQQNLAFRDGFVTILDSPKDGNCQFSAVVSFLEKHLNLVKTVAQLKNDVVVYISGSPCFLNSTPMEFSNFIKPLDVSSYFKAMALNGTYGDHVTLQALACLYKIQFIVLSSLGEGTRIISPDVSNNFLSTLPALILGHYAETQGTHYVSLQAESEKVFGDLLRSLQLTTVQSEPAGVEKLQEHESLSVLHETAQAADRFVPTVNIDAVGSQEVKYAQNEMNNLKYPKACKN